MLGIVSYHPSVKSVDKHLIQLVDDVSCTELPKAVSDQGIAVSWTITKYQEIILMVSLLRIHYQVKLANSLMVMDKLL